PFFFSSRRRHTRSKRDWSSDVCSSDLDWLVPTTLCHAVRSFLIPQLISRYSAAQSAAARRVVFTLRRAEGPGKKLSRSPMAPIRSEERRVGKEGSHGWWR